MFLHLKKKTLFTLTAIVFCFYTSMTYALPTDNQQTMYIMADSTLINYKTGVYIYEGHVKINQGTTQLTADRIITKKNAQHKIEEAVAYGIQQLAEYITLPKEGDPLLHAQAKVILFHPLESKVTLENNVIVTQGESSFHGPMIIYNIKEQIITAPSSKKGRASIIIEPKQLQS